jgi:hypothetical protein
VNTIRPVPSTVDVQCLASPSSYELASVARKPSRFYPKRKFSGGIERNPILARKKILQCNKPALIPKGQIDVQHAEPSDQEFHNELSVAPIDHTQAGSRDASLGGQTHSRHQDRLPKYLFNGPEKISVVLDGHSDPGKGLLNRKGAAAVPTKFLSLSTTGRPEYDEHVAKIISTVKFSANSAFALVLLRLVQARLDSSNRWCSSLDLQDRWKSLLIAKSDTTDLIAKLTPHLRAIPPLVLLNLRAHTIFTKQSIGAAVRLAQRSALQIVSSEWTDP